MHPAKRSLALVTAALCGAALCAQVSAATLTSAFEFNGDFRDSVIEGHDNDLVSGTRGVGAGTLTASTFQFGGNQGVTLSNAVANIESYSIELYFMFGADNQDANYRTILDPGSARSDLNLYARGDERLQFFPGPNSDPGVLLVGAPNHLVYTRASSGVVQVYANGVLVLTDTSGSTASQSVATDNVIHFFEDDAGEVASGEVDYIRLYDGVLSATDASRLFNARNEPLSAVPVPAALPLLLSALGVVGLRRRTRAV